ncbi:hypothetical protein [Robiginitalea marina]|uniref:Late embryogenesis abundant protein LEA-2 subgroup domain-containing protein n=1 Tax=Robiginitalea marina TaxID=2954105 RepID=A0ABT1B271_9FLAO|nr:hypothetical protein [Robiginitalea marina]MCO5725518.1 hypothetical protein [Robiginitalea marina]
MNFKSFFLPSFLAFAFLLACKDNKDQRDHTPAVTSNGNNFVTNVNWGHYYDNRPGSKKNAVLTMLVPLKNVSGQKFDDVSIRAEIDIEFEHKTFNLNLRQEITGGSLNRLNGDDQLPADNPLQDFYLVPFIIEKTVLPPETFKHKPKNIQMKMTVYARNAVGYSNFPGDVIFSNYDGKINLPSW